MLSVEEVKEFVRKRKETAEQRLEICKTCEFLTPVTNRCQKCGCFMNFKVSLPSSTCPIGNWSSYEENI